MSDNRPENKNIRNDEIDLLELTRRIGATFRHWVNLLFKGILISIIFLIKKWLPLTLSVIAGIIISYVLKSTSDSFYTSDIVFRNNLVLPDKKNISDNYATTAELISKINKLHLLCAESNLPALSAALSINQASVKNISDISAFWLIDEGRDGVPDYVDYKGSHSVYDTINIRMPNSIDIRVKISSSLNLDQVREGIVKFIESDSLYQQRNRVRLHQNREMLSRLNYDIKQLDSLQKVKYFEETRNAQPKNGGQIVFMQEQKTQLVYNDIYFLYAKKQFLESERDLYKGIVTVLSDFTLPTRRENGAMYYGKNIIPFTFFATLLVLILFANRKKIKEIFERY